MLGNAQKVVPMGKWQCYTPHRIRRDLRRLNSNNQRSPPMTRIVAGVVLVLGAAMGHAYAQNAQPAAVSKMSDVYHVMFVKAAPGQAAALQTTLLTQNAEGGIPDHKLMLRHAEGAEWDFLIIQHMGTNARVAIPAAQAPASARPGQPPPQEWHNDTFVGGPSWEEFSRLMGLTGAARAVYVVGRHRAVPGHATQLQALLEENDPGSKVPVSHVALRHIEGGQWTFLSIDRYNSWQDFATDEKSSAADTLKPDGGWLAIRNHSSYHNDTITDRIFP